MVEQAWALRKQNPHYVLVGEDQGVKIDGFAYGNSPSELARANLHQKVVVQRTSQGTQGIIHAVQASEILFGTFVVAAALEKYIRRQQIAQISLVAMAGPESEDDVFAGFFAQRLLDRQPSIAGTIDKLRRHPAAMRFENSSQPQFPHDDLEMCLAVDKLDLVPIVKRGAYPIIHGLSESGNVAETLSQL